MAKAAAASKTRIDPFLAWLQKQIHFVNDERTDALREIDRLRKVVEELDAEVAMLEHERDDRVHVWGDPDAEEEPVEVPDFPPEGRGEEEDEPTDTGVREDARLPYSLVGVPLRSKAYKQITLRQVRDWAQHLGQDWFTTATVAEELGFERSTAQRRCKELVEAGTLLHRGNTRSSMYMWNPMFPKGPTTAPRSEPRVAATVTQKRGKSVAHTGKLPGASGRPGRDRKTQERIGRKVKDKRKK